MKGMRPSALIRTAYRFKRSGALICVALWGTTIAAPITAWDQVGVASWYGGIFQGRQTASGETYNTHAYTCAHRTLPFGTRLQVTNLANGKTVEVRVNDRGPYASDRIVDLTWAAAHELGMIQDGTARVHLHTTDDMIPPVQFTIQIGAWRELRNATMHRQQLEAHGFHPIAHLGSDGITRIQLENVGEPQVYALSQSLQALGYNSLFIYQDTGAVHAEGR